MNQDDKMAQLTFATVYPLYVAKLARKNRSQAELDQVIQWLTGYSPAEIAAMKINPELTLESFFDQAPQMNPNRSLITGSICGVKVQKIQDPLVQNVRYLDKLVDNLYKGKSIEKVLFK
ncbi:DUF2200 domain-containing protein [Eremococcus coleocola]|uniref:DUF2200 domain-containing protein n=1 Tax=Eremococcus coleocola ACS-139-V-Col8 TaxID=908337 RepID=E4KPS7_9LACT|nr:DUF2200 domain-containing protein [Eremococcus coleocola]EFR31029.1 hypothetical protein HMPREF9257_1566 [Eremococcus coleocola ACS-139-V-Col8]